MTQVSGGTLWPRQDKEYGNIGASVGFFQLFAIPPAASILDIGTNRGSFPAALAKLGYQHLRGIDISPEAIDNAQRHHPQLAAGFAIYDGKSIPAEANSLDVVTAFDVLEHVPVPLDWLQEIRRVLKPGGLFIFQTPNQWTNVPWETIEHRSFTVWRVDHCSLQTIFSLPRLLTRAGFVEPEIRKFNLVTPYNIQKTRRVMGPIGPVLLRVFNRLPLACFPNFWGSARKPS